MIGVDIVDITEAKKTSNWQRPRFLEKLFTLHERELIHKSKNSFLMVWQLWSMKEAAYKLYTQIQLGRFYNPKQFACVINEDALKVIYKNFQCFINTKITPQYILSEARLLPSKMISKCIKLPSKNYIQQSQTTKAHLMTSASKRFRVLQSELKIEKSEFGIPYLYYKSKKIANGISISHHGYYGSYAIS